VELEESSGSSGSSDAVATNVTVVAKKKKTKAKAKTTPATTRFRWSKKVKTQVVDVESGSIKIMYPFLDDTNELDYLYSRELKRLAPHRAAYSEKTNAWEGFNKCLIELRASDGSFPFIGISVKTARSRLSDYEKLYEAWCEKTGSTDANNKTEDDDDGSVGGYANLIRRAVLDILKGITDDKKRQVELNAQNVLETRVVEGLKARALGCVRSGRFLRCTDLTTSEEENDEVNQALEEHSKKKKKKNSGESDAVSDSMVMLKARYEHRDKRKLDAMALKEKALETESKRIAMEAKRTQMMADQMKMTMNILSTVVATVKTLQPKAAPNDDGSESE
jgi:hypothetical protein